MTSLVGFALKLRNLGVPDHGLLRELSPCLAGSIYTGEGHSRIHEDAAVYTLAVRHALETASLPAEVAPVVRDYAAAPKAGDANPFILPWAMRGVLEEDFVRSQLQEEVQDLLRLFDDWKPASKTLKDVRWRLEAVKSKL